jgi:hypothetical protein
MEWLTSNLLTFGEAYSSSMAHEAAFIQLSPTWSVLHQLNGAASRQPTGLERLTSSSQPNAHTAKTKCRKFETNIPIKGIWGPQSQFLHSCVCERIIYFLDGSDFSAGGNMWTDPGNI